MSITQIIDFALPFTAEENKCGIKKKEKLLKRSRLIHLLCDYREGKEVDFSSVEMVVSYVDFMRRVKDG